MTVFLNLFNLSLRQIMGIPMGYDPAPSMADLFQYHYENEWLLDNKKRDLQNARFFGNLFRLINNLTTINYHLGFNQIYKDI